MLYIVGWLFILTLSFGIITSISTVIFIIGDDDILFYALFLIGITTITFQVMSIAWYIPILRNSLLLCCF